VHIASADPEAVAAVHKFLDHQISAGAQALQHRVQSLEIMKFVSFHGF